MMICANLHFLFYWFLMLRHSCASHQPCKPLDLEDRVQQAQFKNCLKPPIKPLCAGQGKVIQSKCIDSARLIQPDEDSRPSDNISEKQMQLYSEGLHEADVDRNSPPWLRWTPKGT